MDSVLGCRACSWDGEREQRLERGFSGQGAGFGSRTPGSSSALPGVSRVNLEWWLLFGTQIPWLGSEKSVGDSIP